MPVHRTFLYLLIVTQLMTVCLYEEGLTAQVKEYKIGVAWQGKSGMAKRVFQGLRDMIETNAPQISIELRQDLPSEKILHQVVTRFQAEKTAMVLLRSSGVTYLKKHPISIPTFIGGCNDPIALGLITNRDAPSGLITGVTYAISHERQFEIFKRLLPHLRSILLLTEKEHPGGLVDRNGTRAACKKFGISYHETICASLEEATHAVISYAGTVDAVIIGNQARLFDNAVDIIVAAGKTPVLAYTRRPVYDGALSALSADDVKLGRMLGKSIIDVVIGKKPIKAVPIKYDQHPKLYINIDVVRKEGRQIPFDILYDAEIVEK